MSATNGTQKYRIEQLEKRLDKQQEKLDDIKNEINEMKSNHLHHIEMAITKLETRVSVTTVLNVSAIIIAIMMQRWLFG